MISWFKRLVTFYKRVRYTYRLQRAIDYARLSISAERAYVDMLAHIEYHILRDDYRFIRVNYENTQDYITIEIRRNPITMDETIETQTKEKADECIKKQ